jgi:hypothetical protein
MIKDNPKHFINKLQKYSHLIFRQIQYMIQTTRHSVLCITHKVRKVYQFHAFIHNSAFFYTPWIFNTLHLIVTIPEFGSFVCNSNLRTQIPDFHPKTLQNIHCKHNWQSEWLIQKHCNVWDLLFRKKFIWHNFYSYSMVVLLCNIMWVTNRKMSQKLLRQVIALKTS